MTVSTDARITRVNDVSNTRHGQRCLRHIGREYNPHTCTRSVEDAILLGVTQTGIERQYLNTLSTTELLCQVTNLPLSRTKNQYIAARSVPLSLNLIDKLGHLTL